MHINAIPHIQQLQAQLATDTGDGLRWLNRKWRSMARICLFLLMVTLMSGAVQAQANVADDKKSLEVAQVVIGISSYVRWPMAAPELQICMAGKAKYAGVLQKMAVPGSGYRFRTQQPPFDSPALFVDCQIVYIGVTDDAERNKLFAQISGRPILSISEPSVFCAAGSMFCLKFRDTYVAFDINLDAVARSGLRVHPNVLQLSKRQVPQP